MPDLAQSDLDDRHAQPAQRADFPGPLVAREGAPCPIATACRGHHQAGDRDPTRCRIIPSTRMASSVWQRQTLMGERWAF
jgi:hypothetical protein